MKIEKATEILGDILHFVKPGEPQEEHDAIKLGIEALKLLQQQRNYLVHTLYPTLPGETEDSSEAAQEINPEETID